MKLSVIIVNYNVEHFLEQCLHSVRRASKNVDVEVFVVDNNSVDGSVAMVRDKFPEVKLIANEKNTGFSYANNQAIKASAGEYVLLLNPDTVVEEDTFEKVVKFMDQRPDAGGLGVQMLDGKGNFLPESKRGLPTPAVAFYKISGLSKLFPRSRTFGRYHLGFLDKDKEHEVEILSGAFMLMRRSALDKVGLLDENFFMYGEDIDLSYRLIKGGYKNYYYPGTRIIHYKGESTRKSSVNYVFVFYNAMIIFARKHFSQKNAKTFSLLINFAIYLRAAAAIASRFARRMFLPLFDAALLFGGIYLIKHSYEQYVRYPEGGSYPPELLQVFVPIYIFIWIVTTYFSGGYDKPVKLSKIFRGVLVGTGLILIFYSLLPEVYRYTRALILLGSAWTAIALLTTRLLFHFLRIKGFALDADRSRRIVIVGNEEECQRVHGLLKQTSVQPGFVGFAGVIEHSYKINTYLGNFSQLREIINIYKIDEVVFCAKDVPAQQIIGQMAMLGDTEVDYKIAPPESLSIIGSNSIDTAGDLYVIDINSVTKAVNRRNKRVLDVMLALGFIPALPFMAFVVKKPGGFAKNIVSVLTGRRSWVGLAQLEGMTNDHRLPKIKPGILTPADAIDEKHSTPLTAGRLNMVYAKDYKITNDLSIIWKGIRKLGN
jgi:O-antigen biosynthesis protein